MNANIPRITARVDAETQHMLSQAAALSGMSSINSFVLNAAIEKAKNIIEREQQIKLSRQDAIELVNALDNEAKAHPRLQQAVERYITKASK